jgi:hypothetical protein
MQVKNCGESVPFEVETDKAKTTLDLSSAG